MNHRQIGLLKCFGDVCSALTGGGEQQGGNSGGKHKGSGGNDSPPPIPGWGPPMSGGDGGGGGGGGGGKALFEVSAVFAVILLSASVLCALGSALLEVGGWAPLMACLFTFIVIHSSYFHAPCHHHDSSRACRAGTT